MSEYSKVDKSIDTPVATQVVTPVVTIQPPVLPTNQNLQKGKPKSEVDLCCNDNGPFCQCAKFLCCIPARTCGNCLCEITCLRFCFDCEFVVEKVELCDCNILLRWNTCCVEQ